MELAVDQTDEANATRDARTERTNNLIPWHLASTKTATKYRQLKYQHVLFWVVAKLKRPL